MEAQYLLDIVGNTLDNDVDTTSIVDAKNGKNNENEVSTFPDASASLTISSTVVAPQWSLTVLEEDPEPLSTVCQSTTGSCQGVSKAIRRNKNKTKEKWKLKKHLPLESFYQSPEDWEDLYLMRKLVGGKGQSSDSESSTEADSDQSDSDSRDHVVQEVCKLETAFKKPRKPVEESIRKKVLETRNLLYGMEVNDDLLAIEALGHLHSSHCEPVLNETKTEDIETIPEEAVENMEVMLRPEYVKNIDFEEVDEIEAAVVPKKVYNISKRKFEAEKAEARRTRRRKTTRVVRWYEKQPFEDPVLEAKRLRALKAKINHDKNRIDVENLRIDARELNDENSSLKEELLQFKQREAELMQKLKDKEATEVRVKELEREVELRRQNEEALQSQLKDLSEPHSIVVLQVDGITTRDRSAGK